MINKMPNNFICLNTTLYAITSITRGSVDQWKREVKRRVKRQGEKERSIDAVSKRSGSGEEID